MIAAGTVGAASAGPADVLYVYHPPPTVGLAGLVFKTFRGLPIVYHIADMWPESAVESACWAEGSCVMLRKHTSLACVHCFTEPLT